VDAPVEQEFKLLSLKDFSANTQNLLPWFKIDKRVFFICPNLKEMCDSIERTAKVYPGDRGSQLEVFTKMVEKFQLDKQLKKVIEGIDPGKPELNRQAVELLLATLVHRLWKIQNPDPISKASFTSMFKSVASVVVRVPQYSQLETIVIFPTLNNIKCLDDIDALTIYNSCKTLSLFMKENNRYLEFPHYKTDARFFDSLQEIQNHYQATFEKRAKAWIELQCAYTLFGAYYVLYDQAGSSSAGCAMQQVLLNGINPEVEIPLNKEDSLYAVRTLFHFYLAYAGTEQQVNWKLYNSAGKVEILMQDCRAVENKLSQPEQTTTSAFGFNF